MRYVEGNGHGKGVVQRVPVGPGHVVYCPGDPPPPPEELPIALEANLLKDLQEHPEVRVTAVLPLVRDGNTVKIHLWYETLQQPPR